MSLEVLEKAMGKLLWQAEGHGALQSPESFQGYLDTLDPASRQALEALPFDKLLFHENRLHHSVDDILTVIYPYTKLLLAEAWHPAVELYRRFMPNRSFQVFGETVRFIEFIRSQEQMITAMPYLTDLALYEWLEFEVLNRPEFTMPEGFRDHIPQDEAGFETLRPFWNPIQACHAFDYHVPNIIHRLKALQAQGLQGEQFRNAIEIEAQETHALIYRDPETLEPRFFLLNALSAHCLTRISPELSYTGVIQALYELEPSLKAMEATTVLSQLLAFFAQCQTHRILLGSAPV